MDDPYVERDPFVARFSRTNWAVWRLIPKAELWEAAALSLGIEPDPQVLRLRDCRAIGPEAERAREFLRRMNILLRNVGDDDAIAPIDMAGFGWEQVVRLSDVAAWAKEVGLDMPNELRELAATTHPGAVAGAHDSPPAAPSAMVTRSTAGTDVRWTEHELQRLKAYKAEHGTKKAAEHFQVSQARVRKLLSSEGPSTGMANNPFAIKSRKG